MVSRGAVCEAEEGQNQWVRVSHQAPSHMSVFQHLQGRNAPKGVVHSMERALTCQVQGVLGPRVEVAVVDVVVHRGGELAPAQRQHTGEL